MKIQGSLVDIHKREIYPAEVNFDNGLITSVRRIECARPQYILPGLIDSHIHIESSMITPGAFATAAVRHGTTGVVSDPHEIANVLGIDGIDFMIQDAKSVPVRFWFGASSCVPATTFETSGASIGRAQIVELLSRKEIKYLAEMMNYPGVVYNDKNVIDKIRAAGRAKKPVDGHAPGLTGEMLKKYVSAGISTDHECSTIEEAREKLSYGMKILIREGSAARNLEALKDLYKSDPEMVMLCSDDLHPEMLQKRHLNKLIAQLINEGYDLFDVIRSCTVNPVSHYTLEAGLLMPGQPADMIVVDELSKMNVIETWINGELAYANGEIQFSYKGSAPPNRWNCSELDKDDIRISGTGKKLKVIEAFDGELFTKTRMIASREGEECRPDTSEDILKIVVKDRYNDSAPVTGFINGFGLKNGAFASSVAHDSHNIIAVGTNDNDLIAAINAVIRMKGGLSVSHGTILKSMRLDIAGIMTSISCDEAAAQYMELSDYVKTLGSTLKAPFMTLSFMALLVIPELKIGDKGLFDGKNFCITSLFEE